MPAKGLDETATGGGDYGPVVDRHEEIDGYRLGFTRFRENVDGTALMKGLPDDRCQCPHWDYVITGKADFRYADGEEVSVAGDAFYTPPKHEPGTEVVMFSPADELSKTEAVMMRNMQERQSA